MASSRPRWPDPDDDPSLAKSFDLLRAKWKQIPVSHRDRRYSHDCEAMADDELLSFWRQGAQTTSAHHRDWYQTLYRDSFRGKRLIDYGCGLGFDTLMYAQNGARVTFIDIVESNVKIVERLAAMLGLQGCEFLFLKDLGSLAALSGDYDVIYCCGSMICAPLWVIRKEAQALLQHLPVGGRWMELAYPRVRWEREGSLPFEDWGAQTDGGAPWMEWHDSKKVTRFLEPARFDVVLELDFKDHYFTWIDLIRRE